MKIVFICVSLIVFSVSFLPLIVSSDLPTFLIGCLLIGLFMLLTYLVYSIVLKILEKENQE
jgi:hypothetical protein|nr:MAG TPA: hypothetical protein [Caudoviricetes sp.]DAQ28595.1 MAG TPA: hypothetical protein [Caudoviricetes sp.]